eukprot:gene31498-38067_t
MAACFLPNGQDIVRIHPTKEIYILKSDPTVVIKTMEEPITPAIQNEIDLQIEAAKLGVAPSLYKYYTHGGKVYIEMEKLEGMCLADMYGDTPEDIPDEVWDQVHDIIRRLYMIGIHYVDISPYNFIVDDKEKVKVIDFGHAKKADDEVVVTLTEENTSARREREEIKGRLAKEDRQVILRRVEAKLL